MTNSTQYIEEKLNSCALIVRKYNLGDREFFFKKFPALTNSSLTIAWDFGLKKIQNKEIIKDVILLHKEDLKIVTTKVNSFGNDPDTLYYYLNSTFEVKKLKLTDENIERRFRKLLAINYLQIVSTEIHKLSESDKRYLKPKVIRFVNKFKYLIIAISIAGIFSIPRIIKGLTPVETLTEQIHEKSKYKYRTGATCRDGTHSNAKGSGACSHHGGVDEWIYETAYRKTLEECRKEAEEISWRN